MAYLNQAEREQLLEELRGKNFKQIKNRLARMGERSRLKYFRNSQEVGRWLTAYVIDDMGIEVTLVETTDSLDGKRQWTLQEIIIAPTPDNTQ